MAEHLSLDKLGVHAVRDLGAIGREPPPFEFKHAFGLEEISPEAAPAPSPAHGMRLGL